MPGRRSVPPRLAHGPFTTATALDVVSRGRLRGGSHQRVMRGVHAAAGPLTYGDRLRAARQILPPDSVLGRTSAMWALGAEVAWPDDAVEVVLPPGRRVRKRPGIYVRGEVLAPEEVVMTDSGPATSPPRTAFDLARSGEPTATVPLLDALVRATRVSRAHVLAVADAHPRARWRRRVAPVLDLVDPAAESVRESLLRVTLVLAGLPRPVSQFTILGPDGAFVARVDLAWPELRVAVEYDGAHHDDPGRIVRDRARLNAIRRVGWTVLVVDAAQLAHRAATVALISDVLGRADRV